MGRIVIRGQRYYYRRRVPAALVPICGKEVKKALKTDSPDVASRMAAALDEVVESWWAELRNFGQSAQTQQRYEKATALAMRLGWTYRPLSDLAAAPVTELAERLSVLPETAPSPVVRAILGAEQRPILMLAEMLPEVERLTPEALMGKSADQARRCRNPRGYAVRSLVLVIGDKPVAEIGRDDALTFRDYWVARMRDEGLDPSLANKDLIYLKGMLQILDHSWIKRVIFGGAIDGKIALLLPKSPSACKQS